jgi:hypothetical protein
MLEATSERSWRGRFRVTRDDRPVGDLEFRAMGESGAIEVGDQNLTVRREGRMSGAWLLEEHTGGPKVLATAEKPSAWRNSLLLRLPDRPQLRLERPSAWRAIFELTEAGRTIGSIRRSGVWRPRVQVDLPEDLPLRLQLFTLWMALLLYRRDDSAAASAAASG